MEPLQQYLVDFPDGRKQALGLAWDSRAPDAGGQRWFHLYPGEQLRAGERLHWTSLDQNWNFQCADCHSTNVKKGFDPARDTFATTLGSFAQSRMHERGVTCVGCHLPPTTYMVIDPRNDHSMRIPRPDRAVALGTPDACTGCHADQSADWAARAVRRWYPTPTPGFQDFAEAFASTERGAPTALAQLAEIATRPTEPALVRASALARLAHSQHPARLPTLRASLQDPDPLVRMAAVAGLGATDVPTRSSLLPPLLDDPSRLVRIEAARVLAVASVDAGALQRATDEFLAELRFLADRPEAHLALGNFAAARGHMAAALREVHAALAIAPSPEAAVNLADLHRARERKRKPSRCSARRSSAIRPPLPCITPWGSRWSGSDATPRPSRSWRSPRRWRRTTRASRMSSPWRPTTRSRRPTACVTPRPRSRGTRGTGTCWPRQPPGGPKPTTAPGRSRSPGACWSSTRRIPSAPRWCARGEALRLLEVEAGADRRARLGLEPDRRANTRRGLEG